MHTLTCLAYAHHNRYLVLNFGNVKALEETSW